jgi:hypothetical protein
MNHSNMFVVGLALCCFANISSEEMSRDLVNEIEKLLGSSNTYIRKKVLAEPRRSKYIFEPPAGRTLRDAHRAQGTRAA